MGQQRQHPEAISKALRHVVMAVATLSCLGSAACAQDDPRARIRGLVQKSVELEHQNAPAPAAAALAQAIAALSQQPGHSPLDMAVLTWRRAFLELQAYQVHAPSRCDAPLTPVLAAAAVASDAAAKAGNPALSARVDHVQAAAALEAGQYSRAVTLGLQAQKELTTIAPCEAAASARVAAQGALLERDISTAQRAITLAEGSSSLGACPAATGLQDRVLSARLDIARGDFNVAKAALEALQDDPNVRTDPVLRGGILYNLSEVALMQGLYARAEILNDDARAAYSALGPDHPVQAQTDHRAAIIRQELGDLEAAGEAYDRALSRLDCRLGAAHPVTLSLRRESALLLSRSGDHRNAIARARDTLNDARAAGAGAYDLALDQAALGLVLHDAGAPEAEATLQAALAAFSTQERSELDQTPGLLALAEIALDKHDAARAEALSRKAAEILTANGSNSIQRLGRAHRLLATALLAQDDPSGALALARANRSRVETQLADTARLATYTSDLAPEEIRLQLAQLADLLWDGLRADPANEDLKDELFQSLQAVQLTGAARATANLGLADARNDPELAAFLTGERVMLARIEGLERALRGEPTGARRDGFSAAILSARAELRDLRARYDGLPGIAASTPPSAIYLSQSRAALRSDQALWMQAGFDDATYLALITPTGSRLTRVPFGASAIESRVRALRGAVDLPPTRPPKAESFPADEAHWLYCVLFQPTEAEAACPDDASGHSLSDATAPAGTELFLIPDRAMQQMTMSVLLTRPLDGTDGEVSFDDLRNAAWFARRHPHQTAPSVAAFAMRSAASATPKARAFVGFAPFGPVKAGLCPVPTTRADMTSGKPLGLGLVDPSRAAAQARLPGTVELVRGAAATARAQEGRDWFICDQAGEARIKAQDLSAVDTLLLATHAEVGDLPKDLPEPGLFFAPPPEASVEDDGYLKASEIAQMTINANLVILSACSTGSDSGLPGASGLSGVARAFFRAGARSLVVSHWDIAAVPSSALFEALMAERRAGHGSLARDLQAAMLRVMETPSRKVYAHPFVWAPFTVVVGR